MAWTNPRTWVAGEVVTAALLNTHLRDNLLAGGEPASGTAPASAGFNSGTTVYRAGRVVTVYVGLDSTAANAAGTLAATVPAGFRPITAVYFMGVDTATGAAVPLSISTGGLITHILARSAGQGTLGVCTYLIT